MKTLDEIAIEHGTDKATQFTRTYAKPKGYTLHYERFFDELRDKPIKLVEIGVGGGESVRTWLEYFPNALVMGIDNVHSTNQWNTPQGFQQEENLDQSHRYAFMAADQTDPTFWACFAADVGRTIDIAIDDGSHEPKAVQISLEGLWPCVKPGGLYCIEDLGCGFTSEGFPNHYEWAGSIAVKMLAHGFNDIDSIYIARELCIIRKKPCTPP